MNVQQSLVCCTNMHKADTLVCMSTSASTARATKSARTTTPTRKRPKLEVVSPDAGYARASEDPRETLSSVSDQVAAGNKLGDVNDWGTARWFVDNDVSADGTHERDDFDAMCTYLRTRRVARLRTFSSSRLTRDKRTFLDLVELLAERGTLIVVDGKSYDMRDPSDQFQLGILNQFDVYFLQQLKKNVRLAMNSNAAKGKPHGNIPFGYERTYDERTGKPESQRPVEPAASDFKRYAAAFIADEMSLGEIAKATGRSSSSVRMMLSNATTAACASHDRRAQGEASHRARDDRVLPRQLGKNSSRSSSACDLAQARCRQPRVRTTSARVAPCRMLLCDVCDAKLTCRKPSGADKFRRYVCSDVACRKVASRADDFDAYFESKLDRAVLAAIKVCGDPTDDSDDVSELHAQLAQLEADSDELLDFRKQDRISLAEYTELRDDNTAKRLDVEQQLDELSATFALSDLLDEQGRPLVLAECDDETKSRIAKRLVEYVRVAPTGRHKLPEWKELTHIEWR